MVAEPPESGFITEVGPDTVAQRGLVREHTRQLKENLAFTLQVYRHRSEGRDRDAAQMIAALIVPKEPPHRTDERKSRPPN